MTHRLIITADDYGMCEAVNEAIEECLAAGTLRATCVMTNMPVYEAAAGLRDRHPGASVGLHWTLTQGQPVLPAAQVPSLVGPDGQFASFAELRRRLLRRQIDLKQVRAELRAQHERFVAILGRPDFWNTHEGIHVAPAIFQTCVDVARELGIPAMRCHRRVTVPRQGSARQFLLRHPLYWLKGRLVAAWSRRAEGRGMLMPDGLVTSPGFRDKSAIEEIVARMSWGGVRRAVEYIIHPSNRNHPELFGSMTESRLREYETFRDPGLRGRLRQAGIEPVGFEVLHGH